MYGIFMQCILCGCQLALSHHSTYGLCQYAGFGAGGAAWLPTVKELFLRGDKVADLEVTVFDNRGIGHSSCPSSKIHYTTDIMAADALALMVRVGKGSKTQPAGISVPYKALR
ncbi:hypothetical protein Vretimale_7304, partial [Volvox reticuliferus]